MITTGKYIQSNGIVTNAIDLQKQIQPTGFDITVKNVYSWSSSGTIDFDNSKRQLAQKEKIQQHDGIFELDTGSYLVEFTEKVNVVPDHVLYMHPRSTLMRMGGAIQSSIFDPGYAGPIFAVLTVMNGYGLNIHEHARLAQIVCHITSEPTEDLYTGVYNKS